MLHKKKQPAGQQAVMTAVAADLIRFVVYTILVYNNREEY